MDASRRNANGELAEILGPALVQHDKTQRVLQIRLTAQRIYGNLSADDRRAVRRLRPRRQSLHRAVASNRTPSRSSSGCSTTVPQPWTGVDSISVGLLMVQTLDTHIATKLARGAHRRKTHNPALEADLYPVGSWRDRPPTGVKLD